MSWRQPFFKDATEHQNAYAFNGTASRDTMDSSNCDAFNRTYDDNAWLLNGGGGYGSQSTFPQNKRFRQSSNLPCTVINYRSTS